MATTSTPNRTRHGKLLDAAIPDAMICMISVGRDAIGAPTGLKVLPTRADDAHVYYPNHTRRNSTGHRPRQLVWVVNYLRPGEKIRIEAKPDTPDPDVFATRSFDIVSPNQYVATGPVKSNKQTGAAYAWSYSVSLEGGVNPVPALDPTVIVTEEP